MAADGLDEEEVIIEEGSNDPITGKPPKL